MDTDDEHDPSLSQATLSAISGVNIAVLDTNGDALESTIDETERAVVKETLKDLWVELQTRGGNAEAGQTLVLEWYSVLESAKSSGPLRAKPPIRTTPYGPSTKPSNAILVAADSNRAENSNTPTTVVAS